jgi:hypothetical protein
MLGDVPMRAEVMWHYPAVLKDALDFTPQNRQVEPTRPQPATPAGMAAAGAVGCSYCQGIGYFMAHNRGLDESKVREVPLWRTSGVFTPLERKSDGVRRGDEPDTANRY